MPVLPTPDFNAPFAQFSKHLQTIVPSLFRKVAFQYQQRERLELPDGDFVDLDWHRIGKENRKLIIITHGLEGDSHRHYVLGMASLFTKNGYDALGWNCRSCSGEMNRLPRFYHHGDAGDLRLVIQYAIEQYHYAEIILVGFSMGGSLSLRAVGEFPDQVAPQIQKVIGFSVPCDLLSSVKMLSEGFNTVYGSRFLKKLGVKIREKEKVFPDLINSSGYEKIKHFVDFDNRYTAPLHGFSDAYDFYTKASVKPLLPHIKVPSLLVQAKNDSFLSAECFCEDEAANNPHLFLEMPENGGHCGFMQRGNPYSWAELRALGFVTGH
jgi:uncharacterized protein